jgi:hypothetical protein
MNITHGWIPLYDLMVAYLTTGGWYSLANNKMTMLITIHGSLTPPYKGTLNCVMILYGTRLNR